MNILIFMYDIVMLFYAIQFAFSQNWFLQIEILIMNV